MAPQSQTEQRPLKEAGVETEDQEQPAATMANEPPSSSDESSKKRSGAGRWRRSHDACTAASRADIESGICEADGSAGYAEQAEENSNSRNGDVRRHRNPRKTRNTKGQPTPFETEATADTVQSSARTPQNLALTTDESAPATASLRQRCAAFDEAEAPIQMGRAELTGSEAESDDGASMSARTIERRSGLKRTDTAERGNRRRGMDRQEPRQAAGTEPPASSYRSRPDKVAPPRKTPEQRVGRWRPSSEKTRRDVAYRKPSGCRPNAPQGNATASTRAGPKRDRDGSVNSEGVDRSGSSTPYTDAKSAPRARNSRVAGPGRRSPAASWRTPGVGSSPEQPTLGETRTLGPRRRGGWFSKADPVAEGDACAPTDGRRSSTWRAPKAAKDNRSAGERESSPVDGAVHSTPVRGSAGRASERVTRDQNRPKSSVPRGIRGHHVEPPAKHAPTETSATWYKQASLETRAKKSSATALNKDNKSAPGTLHGSEGTLPNKLPVSRGRRSWASTATSAQQLGSGRNDSPWGVAPSHGRPIKRRLMAEGRTAAVPEAADVQPPVSGHNSSWPCQRHSGTRRLGFHKTLPRANARREFSVQFGATDAAGDALPLQVIEQRRSSVALVLAVLLLVSALMLVLFMALHPSSSRWDGCSTLAVKCAMPGMRPIIDAASTEACHQSQRAASCGCSYRLSFSAEELYGAAVRR